MEENNKRLIDLTVKELRQLIDDTVKNNISTLSFSKVDEGEIIDINEAMKITGYARQTIYQMICARRIPFIKKEGFSKLYFSRKALLAWITEGRK